jgi:hypothetical protein
MAWRCNQDGAGHAGSRGYHLAIHRHQQQHDDHYPWRRRHGRRAYPASGMVVTISEITTNSSGQGTITWSDSLNGTAHTVGQSVTLPTALQIANASLIWSEVAYPYHPTFGYALIGTVNIYQSSYFYPRLSTSVTRVNS